MDPLEKLRLVGENAGLEPSEEVLLTGHHVPTVRAGEALPGCLHHACTPRGNVVLLKGMVTSACERNCLYCPFRAGRDAPRATFTPEELALLFDRFYRAGLAQGLFLSSGIVGGGQSTQDRIIATAEILRLKYRFSGYLHLKIMPGADQEQIRRTMALADRVSINLEAPNPERLGRLAPRKDFLQELVRPLRLVEQLRQEAGGRPGTWGNLRRSGPSLTTQFVVGPAGESDRELLRTTEYLFRHAGLARAYFSAFHPVADTPLEREPPESPLRQRRLYQASYLVRDYGFAVDELAYDEHDALPLDTDPKVAWARRNLTASPVEVNTASRQELLRIPGVGPRLAWRLLEARQKGRLRDLADLGRLGLPAERMAPFILLEGRRPGQQMGLFQESIGGGSPGGDFQLTPAVE